MDVSHCQIQIVLERRRRNPDVIFRNRTTALPQPVLNPTIALSCLGSYRENRVRSDDISDFGKIALGLA